VIGSKAFFAGLGIFATGVAIMGVWLPGIPTTFPLIVALWSFSKSSERLHAWVGSLPVLRQALTEAERFERERSIDWRIKVIATGSAWVSALAVGIISKNMLLTAFVVASALSCTAFMLYIPTRKSSEATAEVDD
jgi:uncharacterized membrane protein YbaN (DUF454 family)